MTVMSSTCERVCHCARMGEFAREARWESKERMNVAFIHHAHMCCVHVRLGKESWGERKKMLGTVAA